jgi:hypothetical protein
MGEYRRNSSACFIILFLMFVFFSFIHEEKERQITGTAAKSSVISNINCSGQAIISATISAPEINVFQTSPFNFKFTGFGCPSGREFIFNNLLSFTISSCQLKIFFRNPIIGLFFLQKVPEQGKEDDILSIT